MSPPPPMPLQCPKCGRQFAEGAQFCPDDGTGLARNKGATDPYLGQKILGHIEIRELAGIGAMGRVYRAFQEGIDRDVAVKILHRELSANTQLVSRFHREAKVASRLVHPNVVHVHLSGQLPDGELYIVMEYLNGLSLEAALREAGESFPLERALHVALQICDAVGEAHVEGVIHRDLKPDNVMLVRRGEDQDFVKVLDFGIAHLSWSDASMATAAGLIFGTARYISPEGAQGGAVGPASDVYSIATLLYQLLAGVTPFEGEQAVGLLVQHIHNPPPPLLSQVRARSVPRPIADVIMANLAKTPETRMPDGHAFGRELIAAARKSGLDVERIIGHPRLSRGNTPSTPEIAARPSPVPGGLAAKTAPFGVSPQIPSGTLKIPSTARSATFDPTPAPPAPLERRPAEISWEPDPSARTVRDSQPPWNPGTPRGAESAAIASEDLTRTFLEKNAGLPRRKGLILALILVCFALGLFGALFVAAKMPSKETQAPALSLDAEAARATDALLHHRWDTPKGDNVRDLTNAALKRFPNAPELLRIRELACDDVIRAARAKQAEGDARESVRLAELAYELDPKDEDARALAAPHSARPEDAGKPHPSPPRPLAPGHAPPGSLAPILPLPSGSTLPHAAPTPLPTSSAPRPTTAPSSLPPASTAKWL